MIFTDDDLKRLKAKEGYWKSTVKMNEGQSESWGFVDGDAIEALLARLEAAEEVINESFNHDNRAFIGLDAWHEAYMKWREAAGK
jgi:hypothetical protein